MVMMMVACLVAAGRTKTTQKYWFRVLWPKFIFACIMLFRITFEVRFHQPPPRPLFQHATWGFFCKRDFRCHPAKKLHSRKVENSENWTQTNVYNLKLFLLTVHSFWPWLCTGFSRHGKMQHRKKRTFHWTLFSRAEHQGITARSRLHSWNRDCPSIGRLTSVGTAGAFLGPLVRQLLVSFVFFWFASASFSSTLNVILAFVY